MSIDWRPKLFVLPSGKWAATSLLHVMSRGPAQPVLAFADSPEQAWLKWSFLALERLRLFREMVFGSGMFEIDRAMMEIKAAQVKGHMSAFAAHGKAIDRKIDELCNFRLPPLTFFVPPRI